MNEREESAWPRGDQIQLLRSSLARLIPSCEAISLGFYDRLFTLAPSLRPLFPVDIAPQAEKLILMLAISIDLLEDRDSFDQACAELGERHVKYGALPEHYPVVCQLAIEEMARLAEPPLSPEEAEAWEMLLNIISASMIQGANPT